MVELIDDNKFSSKDCLVHQSASISYYYLLDKNKQNSSLHTIVPKLFGMKKISNVR